MAVYISNIGRLRVAVEAAFNTDETGTIANFIDLPVAEGSTAMTCMQDHLDPQTMQQLVHAYADSDLTAGKKSSTLNFTTHLAATGNPVTGAVAIPYLTNASWALRRVLGTLMGGASSGVLSGVARTVAAASTASLINTSTDSSGMALPGTAIAVLIAGKYEAREVLSVTGVAITPKVAFSAAPVLGAPILFSTTFHLIENLSGPLPSLQLVAEGAAANEAPLGGAIAADRLAALGTQGTFGIDITPGAIPKLTVQLQGASWNRIAAAALAAPSSIGGFYPVVNMDSELIVGTGATNVVQTRNRVSHSSSTWQPGFAVTPITSPEGLNSSNVVGFKRARGRGVSGNFIAYEEPTATTWLALDGLNNSGPVANRQFPHIMQQIGSTAQGMVLLTAPTAQISVVPTRTDAGGLYSQTISWVGKNDGSISSPTTDLGRSAFRVHIF